jgi:ribonuclease P protein component
MGSGCGWLLNGAERSLAVVAKRGASGLRYNFHPSTPARKPLGFPRGSRLTSETDLESLRRKGKRMQTECLDARVSASLSRCTRIGIVVPKHGWNAVDRNRTKRRLREIVRSHLLPAVESMDILIRARPKAYTASFSELTVQMTAIVNWVSQNTSSR